MCVNIPNNNETDGQVLQQYNCSLNNASQTFILQPVAASGGYYNIKSFGLNLCFTVSADEGSILLNSCTNGNTRQLFGFFQLSGDTSTLRPKYNTSKCVNVSGDTPAASENKLQVNTCANGDNEKFTISLGEISHAC